MSCGRVSSLDCLTWLRNLLYTSGKYKNINYNYDSDSGPGQELHFQSSPGDLAVVEGQKNGKFNQNGKFG